GDLRPTAHLARRGADLDDSLLDFRNLELEQCLYEKRVSATQDQARAFRRLLDALERGTNRLSLMEVLAMVLLAVGQDRFCFAKLVEHDNKLSALDLLDLTGQQLADAIGELVANART